MISFEAMNSIDWPNRQGQEGEILQRDQPEEQPGQQALEKLALHHGLLQGCSSHVARVAHAPPVRGLLFLFCFWLTRSRLRMRHAEKNCAHHDEHSGRTRTCGGGEIRREKRSSLLDELWRESWLSSWKVCVCRSLLRRRLRSWSCRYGRGESCCQWGFPLSSWWLSGGDWQEFLLLFRCLVGLSMSTSITRGRQGDTCARVITLRDFPKLDSHQCLQQCAEMKVACFMQTPCLNGNE